MFSNRLLDHLKTVDSINQLNAEERKRPQVSVISSIYASQQSIYQVAYENAKRDFELDRLFNPDYYEHGGGI